MLTRSICLATLVAVAKADCSTTCRRGQSCWPSSQEVQELYDALDPTATRSLHWNRFSGIPRPAPIPAGALQPLFGSNKKLEPLYEQSPDQAWDCNGGDKFYCHQTTRNNPLKGAEPAFVVWPMSVDHVQKVLSFARDHNLGVSVAGTGHDYLNRHTCDQGIMIRMSFMKDIEWSLNGTDGGSVRVGPGVNFGEIMYSGKDQQPPSYTMSGWVSTVGVGGWSLGGGHGPFGRSRGFGAENVLALEVVTADGEVVKVSADSHPDLYWAMRGGGGSAWGVVTAFTFKAYPTPPGGHALAIMIASGDACEEGLQGLDAVAHGWANWTAGLGHRFSGIFDVSINPNDKEAKCDGSWTIPIIYPFEGSSDDEEFTAEIARLVASFGASTGEHWHVSTPTIQSFDHWWNFMDMEPVELPITTNPFNAENVTFDPKVVGSIAVPDENRDMLASKLVASVKEHFSRHAYGNLQVYHDIPAQACPSRPALNSTALGPGFRDAAFHVIPGASMAIPSRDWWNELAGSSGIGAYFGESSYTMQDWKQVYWGDHYDELLEVKRKYDPTNFFWCHNCVGSDLPRTNAVLV